MRAPVKNAFEKVAIAAEERTRETRFPAVSLKDLHSKEIWARGDEGRRETRREDRPLSLSTRGSGRRTFTARSDNDFTRLSREDSHRGEMWRRKAVEEEKTTLK